MIEKPGLVASWKMYGLSVAKVRTYILTIAFAVGFGSCFLSVPVFGLGAGLGFGFSLALLAGYIIATIPKRSFELSGLRQSREAPTLAAAAAVYLEAMGSRAKTLMHLSSEEPRLSALLDEMKLAFLQGRDIDSLDLERMSTGKVFSSSVMKVLRSVILFTPLVGGESDTGGELDDQVRLATEKEEEKFPIFMTAMMFLPVMTLLALAILHHFTLPYVVATAVLLVMVNDLLVAVSSTERKRLSM